MPKEHETKQYPKGKHPNSLANLKKGPRFGSGAGNTVDARKANEKSTEAKQANKTIKEIALELVDAPQQNGKTLREGLTVRLIKMAAEGNLAAIQFLMKVIGEDPGDTVTVKTPQLSEDAKADIDKLLAETRGKVK
jgi:hypothetical protein|nr:MAG TPA: hypothetical protein [Caudoviricetes sp.]DAZ82918.1 MAG TPA: hypothetical protein [Caudoviricetes sp.]